MKDKLHKFTRAADKVAFEQFMVNHIAYITQCGYLSHYKMRFLESQPKLSGPTAMSIEPDPKYLEFKLNYSEDYAAEYWYKGDLLELLSTVVHEVTHVLTNEVEHALHIEDRQHTIDHHFERLTEHSSRWLYDSYRNFMQVNKIDLKTGSQK